MPLGLASERMPFLGEGHPDAFDGRMPFDGRRHPDAFDGRQNAFSVPGNDLVVSQTCVYSCVLAFDA